MCPQGPPALCSYGSREGGANALGSVDFSFFFATPISRDLLGPGRVAPSRATTQNLQSLADRDGVSPIRTRSCELAIARASCHRPRTSYRSLVRASDRSCELRSGSSLLPIARASCHRPRTSYRSLVRAAIGRERVADRSSELRSGSNELPIARATCDPTRTSSAFSLPTRHRLRKPGVDGG